MKQKTIAEVQMFPRWLSWLVILMVAYVIIKGNRATHPDLPSATPVAVTATAEKSEDLTTAPHSTESLQKATDIERWKRALNPDYAERIQCELKAEASDKPLLFWKVSEDVTGNGSTARCGETITVKLTVWNAQGKPGYSDDMPLLLGAREVAAGLDAALVGIRPGGIRTVILAPAAQLRDKKTTTAPRPLLAALGGNRVAIVTAERIQ